MQKALLLLAFVCLALSQQQFVPCRTQCANSCNPAESTCAQVQTEGTTGSDGCSCIPNSQICPTCAGNGCSCSVSASATSSGFTCGVKCPCAEADCLAITQLDPRQTCPGTTNTKFTCIGDRLEKTCAWKDACPVDCSANCPSGTCPTGGNKYSCLPDNKGGCSMVDKCPTPTSTTASTTGTNTIDCSKDCPQEKCVNGGLKYTCFPNNLGGCDKKDNCPIPNCAATPSPCGELPTTTCPGTGTAAGTPRFTCELNRELNTCAKKDHCPDTPTSTTGSATSTGEVVTSSSTTGTNVIDCTKQCPLEKCEDGRTLKYTCFANNLGGCDKKDNCPCSANCPTDVKCPDGSRKYTCGLSSSGSCTKYDNCQTNTNDCKEACGQLSSEVCPNGNPRFSCVTSTATTSPCVKQDNCPPTTMCTNDDCRKADPNVDVTKTCGSTVNGQNYPRYICVGNVATATSPATCKWRDNCPVSQECTEKDCDIKLLPAGATAASLCKTGTSKKYVCAGELGFCSWRDVCPETPVLPTCEITPNAAGDKTCGGAAIPTCPNGSQLSELYCVATSATTNAQSCAWKYYCSPVLCTDSRCGTKPNCPNAVCRPESLTAATCAWSPATCTAEPCRLCSTKPCSEGSIQTSGQCIQSSVAGVCTWDGLKCESVKCECTNSNTVARCDVGETPDTTGLAACVAGTTRCTYPCVKDKCYSADVCRTDFASGCVFVSSTVVSRGTTAANAQLLAEQLKLKGVAVELIKEKPAKCTGNTQPTTPTDKLATEANDVTNVNTANQDLKDKLDSTRDTIDAATGSALLKDFYPLVLAILTNNDNKKPSIKVNVELVAAVPGTQVTPSHLTVFCKLLTETVFPKITKYTTAELINCKMIPITTTAKRAAGDSTIYTASAEPTDDGVSRIYGSQSSANTYVASVFVVICMFAFLFM